MVAAKQQQQQQQQVTIFLSLGDERNIYVYKWNQYKSELKMHLMEDKPEAAFMKKRLYAAALCSILICFSMSLLSFYSHTP